MNNVNYSLKGDRDLFHANNSVKRLVDFMLDKNSLIFLQDLLLLLRISASNKNNFEKYIKLLDQKFDRLSNDNSLNSDQLKIYPKIINCIYDIYNSGNLANNLRGAVLELLTLKNVENKHFPKKTAISCYISINGWNSEKSVDVFAWCNNKGQIFECKISSYDLEYDHISNLKKIKLKSNNKVYPFFITFESKNALKRSLNVLKNKTGGNNYRHVKYICADNFNDFLKG